MHARTLVRHASFLALFAGCAGDRGDDASSGGTSDPGASSTSTVGATGQATDDTNGSGTATTSDGSTSNISTGDPTDPTNSGSGDTATTWTSGDPSTTGDPCAGQPKCGNGEIDYDCGEQCDLGVDNRDDGECTTQCRGAICGDGLLHPGVEQCDDGNSDPDDACPNHCGNPFTHEPRRLVGGPAHTCALSDAGKVRCWGKDETHVGLLGYGSTASVGDGPGEMPPPDVNLGGTVVQLSAGDSHTCALLAGGTVRCWGYGGTGALGYGDTENIGDQPGEMPPPDVDVGGEVVQIAAGEFGTCALLKTGAVRCWGAHFPEDIGDDPGEMPPPDVPVTGKVVQLHADRDVGCVLRDNGSAACWYTDHVPVETVFGGFVVELSGKVCARLASGALRCIGYNDFGQKGFPGDFYIGDAIVAGDVPVGGAVSRVAPGDYHTCAILTGGQLRCWGMNNAGQLGYGHTLDLGWNPGDLPTPDVDLGGQAIDIVTGLNHTCARLVGGKLRCWGAGGYIGHGDLQTLGDDPGEMPPPDVPVF